MLTMSVLNSGMFITTQNYYSQVRDLTEDTEAATPDQHLGSLA
jgi:hypothetical protein